MNPQEMSIEIVRREGFSSLSPSPHLSKTPLHTKQGSHGGEDGFTQQAPASLVLPLTRFHSPFRLGSQVNSVTDGVTWSSTLLRLRPLTYAILENL